MAIGLYLLYFLMGPKVVFGPLYMCRSLLVTHKRRLDRGLNRG